jgi:PRTRC genetic system protein A
MLRGILLPEQKPMIGYLLVRPEGLDGERGLAYDYILARNGVFLEAENHLIRARIRVASGEIRGLGILTEKVELAGGLVPSYFLAMVLRTMRQDIHREVYAAIVDHHGQYQLIWPDQERSSARVSYQPVPNTVVDFHSHGAMGAHFSHTDDQDDQGFRVSVVIGKLNENNAQMDMRLGVYGDHTTVSFPEVFSGPLPLGLDLAK